MKNKIYVKSYFTLLMISIYLKGIILLFYWQIDSLVKEFWVSETSHSFVSECLYKDSLEPVTEKEDLWKKS